MIVDNGKRRRLVVAGMFDGLAGESEGLLSFIPNRTGRRASDIRAGILDGEVVHLELATGATVDPSFVTFRYRSA